MRVLVPAVLLSLGGCMQAVPASEADVRADASAGELAARPGTPVSTETRTGMRQLGAGEKAALLYVPKGYVPKNAMPLIVMLHGAGGSGRHAIDLVTAAADKLGFIILAPSSRAASWDVISSRRYGADVVSIDAALKQVFANYAVDPERLAVGGFSDGASYALSLGIANGGLFSHIIAFSPGFMAPTRAQGQPRIFISHGVQDQVLPIQMCSRKIVPRLKAAGYAVDYREFQGGHSVPPQLARAAYDALAGAT
jgi:predicted esterase